jgi:hypothetical protein
VIQRRGDQDRWCVLVGAQTSENRARALAERIRQESGEKSAAFVVRVDST